MMWAQRWLVAWLFGWISLTALSQAPDVAGKIPSSPGVPVHLGESAVNLYGPWRFQIGDDPAWAATGFDDSDWESVDLHSPDGADPDLGTSGFVPGWTARGHPDHAGFAWYRLRVNVEGARTGISLKMPDSFDDAYQVFANGQQIGAFGTFGKHGVKAYSALPRGFRLPDDLRRGTIVIAIRFWMDSANRFYTPDAGGLHGPPVLGLAPTVATQLRLDWDEEARSAMAALLEMLVLLLALVVALAHFRLDPTDNAYLWLGLVATATLLSNLVVLQANLLALIPQTQTVLLKDVLLTPMRISLWILFWASWFGLGIGKRLWHLTVELALLLAVGTAMLRPPLHGQLVSLRAGHVLTPAVLWIKLAMAVLLLTVTFRGIRRDRAEGWIALPAIVLAVVANYQSELRILHLPFRFSVFGFTVSIGQISTMVSLVLVTLMASRRFLLAQRQKVQWELEVRQARQMQELIIPRALPQVPGFRIESDYRPSREVSGDFFQIIPHRADGSLLVVVGDVTGKGLRAGMLVALIVGAIDATAHVDADPERMLRALNDRLCERGYATATCLAMRITADGFCSIANAGHLPPYLNGRELAMEGALPLGTLAGLDYTHTQLQLRDGDALMLLTDGVVEAQNDDGEMFGFDRVGSMMAQTTNVHAVADAAERFGQEDDILVLRVERATAASLTTRAA